MKKFVLILLALAALITIFTEAKINKELLKKSHNLKLKMGEMPLYAIDWIPNEIKSKGENEILWCGKDNSNQNVASNIYFYKIRINEKETSGKLTLIK